MEKQRIEDFKTSLYEANDREELIKLSLDFAKEVETATHDRKDLIELSQKLYTKSQEAKRRYAVANGKLLAGIGKLPEHSASKIMWDKEIDWNIYTENRVAHKELDKILTK